MKTNTKYSSLHASEEQRGTDGAMVLVKQNTAFERVGAVFESNTFRVRISLDSYTTKLREISGGYGNPRHETHIEAFK